jgi:hypothetical protein
MGNHGKISTRSNTQHLLGDAPAKFDRREEKEEQEKKKIEDGE